MLNFNTIKLKACFLVLVLISAFSPQASYALNFDDLNKSTEPLTLQDKKTMETDALLDQNSCRSSQHLLDAAEQSQTGKKFELWQQNQETLSASTNARTQSAELLLNTTLFSSSINTQMTAPDMRNPASCFGGDPAIRSDEKLKITLSKTLPNLGINDDISYRSTSRVLTSSMTKEVISHMNLSLDAAYPLDPLNSDVKSPSAALRVNYGIHF